MNQQAGGEPGAAPPQYSSDRRWWWDGREWQPVSAPALRPSSSSPRIRPGRWTYIAAVLTAALGAVVLVFVSRNLAGGFPAIANATRITAPGTTRITLPSAGTYMINYEQPALGLGPAANGRLPSIPPEVASMQLELVSVASAAPVPIRAPSERYAYSYGGRDGVGLAAFTVDRPGAYTLTSRYADGQSEPRIILAIAQGGPNDILSQSLANILAGFAGISLVLLGLGGGAVALFFRMRAGDRARALARDGTGLC